MEAEDSVGSTSENLNMSKFKGWTQIPNGVSYFAPAANFRGQYNDGIDLYATGTDNNLYHDVGSTTNGGLNWSWTGWSSLGAPASGGVTYPLIGRPSATAWSAVRSRGSAVAARASIAGQAQVFVKFELGGSFTSWAQVSNGNLEQDPAIVFSYPYLFVFAPGTDHQFYWSRNDVSQSYNAANWSAWANVPGGNLSSAGGVAAAGGKLFLAARATNNQYYLNKSADAGATWSGWSAVPSGTTTFASAPALTAIAVSSTATTLNLFGAATATGGVQPMLNSTSFDEGANWGTFQSAGGNLASAPAAIAASSTHLETFALGTDNTVYQNTYLE